MKTNSKSDKSKKYLLIAVVFFVVVIISIALRFGSSEPDNSNDDASDDRSCIEAGGTGTVYPGSLSCCSGLTALNCDKPDSDGICTIGCMGSFICANCGNGECDKEENECNCPDDCDESEENEGMSSVEAKSIVKYNSECGSHEKFAGINSEKVSFDEKDQKWKIGLKLSDSKCSGVCVVDPVTKSGVLELDCK